MEESKAPPQTPTDQLADRIRRRLLEEGLLKEEQVDRLLPKLKNGKVKEADWKLAIELSMNPKKR